MSRTVRAAPVVLGLALLAGACDRKNALVPYGEAQGAAVAGSAAPGPASQAKGPLTVKVSPPAGSAPVTPVSCKDKPDRTLAAAQHASGSFGGVQVGAADGARVILRQQGKIEYYVAADEALPYFFVAHKTRGKPFQVTYDRIERCIEHAGGYLPMAKATDASTEGATFGRWWSSLDAEGKAAAKKTFDAYVDSAFVK